MIERERQGETNKARDREGRRLERQRESLVGEQGQCCGCDDAGGPAWGVSPHKGTRSSSQQCPSSVRGHFPGALSLQSREAHRTAAGEEAGGRVSGRAEARVGQGTHMPSLGQGLPGPWEKPGSACPERPRRPPFHRPAAGAEWGVGLAPRDPASSPALTL